MDVLGVNSYRGWHGFGYSFWQDARSRYGKPVLITEYGCPAYHKGRTTEVAEAEQAWYHWGAWADIAANLAGRGAGNALGGGLFEWMDEWWKAGQPPRFSSRVHETDGSWAGPFPGTWSYEEWYGIVGQGDGTHSPFLRQLRPAFRLYQLLWNPGASETEFADAAAAPAANVARVTPRAAEEGGFVQ